MDTLLRRRATGPSSGWRRLLFKVSGGQIDPGESPGELHRQRLRATTRTPLANGHHRVAVLSLKGGVGKTTTAVGLGGMLATQRGDRVIAVDANPDRGTLSERLPEDLRPTMTVRDLLRDRDDVLRYADVRNYTGQAESRLEFLASEQDPAVSEAFSEADYRVVAGIIERFYSICITDCGTGILHSAMDGILDLADRLVIVSPPSVDGARSASATLDWLDAHGHGALAAESVAVISQVERKSDIDLNELESHFTSRCSRVIRVPVDRHLRQGSPVDLDAMHPRTREAFLELAAAVAQGFQGPVTDPAPPAQAPRAAPVHTGPPTPRFEPMAAPAAPAPPEHAPGQAPPVEPQPPAQWFPRQAPAAAPPAMPPAAPAPPAATSPAAPPAAVPTPEAPHGGQATEPPAAHVPAAPAPEGPPEAQWFPEEPAGSPAGPEPAVAEPHPGPEAAHAEPQVAPEAHPAAEDPPHEPADAHETPEALHEAPAADPGPEARAEEAPAESTDGREEPLESPEAPAALPEPAEAHGAPPEPQEAPEADDTAAAQWFPEEPAGSTAEPRSDDASALDTPRSTPSADTPAES
ncbi:nucleotide-binding protein [Murinocardiopsis flavida]